MRRIFPSPRPPRHRAESCESCRTQSAVRTVIAGGVTYRVCISCATCAVTR